MYKAAFSGDDCWLLTMVNYLRKDMLAYEYRTVYKGRNHVIASKRMVDGEVNIKIFRRPGFLKGLMYGWLRKSKAQRSMEYADRLRKLGVATPRPYAYTANYSWLHTLKSSYYICEQLGAEWHEIRYMEERSDYQTMVAALARWVADVHRKGVLVKDLSPGNILFRTVPGGYEFCMVDVNRMGFGCTDRRRQLYRAGWLMNSEESSVDFARHYAAAAGMPEGDVIAIVLGSYRRLQRRAARKKRFRC